MNISIRKFLLLNLLLAITITTTITVVGNYYLDQRDIQEHLDSMLMESALAFEALIANDTHQRNLQIIQKRLNDIPTRGSELFSKNIANLLGDQYQDAFQFQIWNDNGKLLLHSANSPTLPLSNGKPGFNNRFIKGHHWRVYTSYNPEAQLNIVVAERNDIREALVRRIAVDDFYIMLWTYPISGILIWLIVGRGLDSLRRVAREVSHRDKVNLEPVNPDNVPIEVTPLVDELNKLFLRLQEAIERERRFSADAAHELRTPLAALRTQAQVALKLQNEGERKKFLDSLIVSVDRSTHIVEQLLTLSRLVPETHTLKKIPPIEFSTIITETIASLVPPAIEKNIDVEFSCEKKKNKIRGNPTALSILVRNLVDNAIRYTPENGYVLVELLHRKKQLILRVTDDGPGIPPKLRTRVFERFFRVLGSKAPGSGLGLAIVQQIARLHDADLRLGTPTTGKGLEVEIRFHRA